MACFVCDEKLTDDVNQTSQSSDCSRCGPAVSLNWTNGQRILEHMGAHVLHDSMFDNSEKLCGLCLCPHSDVPALSTESSWNRQQFLGESQEIKLRKLDTFQLCDCLHFI